MASERSGAGSTCDEDLGDERCRLLLTHLDTSFYGESFVGEQRRRDGELHWMRLFTIEVDCKPWGQSSNPPGGEPAEGAPNAFRCTESRYEHTLVDACVGQSEKARLQAPFVGEHGYSDLRRRRMRARVASASLDE